MEEFTAEQVADFLLEFIPDALPKPLDSAAKAVLRTWGNPCLRQQLVDAGKAAESALQKIKEASPEEDPQIKKVEENLGRILAAASADHG